MAIDHQMSGRTVPRPRGGRRAFRERQYRVNVAAVASKVIRRAHAESHAGSVATCGTCARDWVVVQEASGIHAPGN